MTDKNVVVYSTPTWPFCKMAKEYLSQKGISYQERNVAGDREAAKEMIDKSKQMSVPVIVINDEILVGFDKSKIDELIAK